MTTNPFSLNGQIIQLTPSPNQSFSVQLQVDGAPLTVNLTIKWNSMAGYWVLSIADSQNNLLLDSLPLVTGYYPAANILSQYEYLEIGSIYILNGGNSFSDYPGSTDLGLAFTLLWADTPTYAGLP